MLWQYTCGDRGFPMMTSSSVYVLFIDDGAYLAPSQKRHTTVASGTRLQVSPTRWWRHLAASLWSRDVWHISWFNKSNPSEHTYVFCARCVMHSSLIGSLDFSHPFHTRRSFHSSTVICWSLDESTGQLVTELMTKLNDQMIHHRVLTSVREISHFGHRWRRRRIVGQA
jgi:hypothetical protein